MKNYSEKDFKTLTGDDTETRAIYRFVSDDEMVEANFFFEIGNVELRGIAHGDKYLKEKHGGIIHAVYPFLRPERDPSRKPPESKEALKSLVHRLKQMEVYKDE